jgi:mannosyltransferase
MKVFYDNIVFWLQKSGGISRYWHELASRFLADGGTEITFIEQKIPCENRFREMLAMKNVVMDAGLPVKLNRYLPVRAKLGGGSVFHSSYYRDCTDVQAAKIVTVHDFTYEIYVKGLKRVVHTAQKRAAVQRADGVICISENTKKDLLRFFPEIDPQKVTVVQNGVGDDFKPSEKSRDEIFASFGLGDDKYAVFMGERGGYKNFDTAVKACALSGHFLLVLGGREVSGEELALLDSALKGRYRIFGYMTNEQIRDIFSAADCLLYPSLYEGFGLPVLEAMRCGCPVVASDCSSLPEAAGDAGVLVDDMTPRGFADAMESIAQNRQVIIAKGFAHSAKFSWDRCFSETKAFYETILAKKSL